MLTVFKRTLVELIAPQKARLVRKRFSGISRDFKNYALAQCMANAQNDNGETPCFREELGEFQTHHILPVSLGGGNEFENLAWVHPRLHEEIHQNINEQIQGMRVGDKRYIMLPMMNRLIWSLPPRRRQIRTVKPALDRRECA